MKRHTVSTALVSDELNQHTHRLGTLSKTTVWLLLATAANIILLIFLWSHRSADHRFAMDTAKQAAATELAKMSPVTTDWVEDYVAQHAYTPDSTTKSGVLTTWLESRLNDYTKQQETTFAAEVAARQNNTTTTTLPSAPSGTATTPSPSPTTAQEPATQLSYTAGDGIVINGLQLSTKLGSVIDDTDIADGSLSFEKLTGTDCASGQTMKYDGTAWACANDDTATLSGPSGSSGRLAFFSTASSLGDSYLSQDGSGITLDNGKNLTVHGLISGDGSGLTNVPGAQLTNGSIGFDKLAQNSCTTGQTLKWSGTAWACANDIDTNTDTDTQYGAGSGLVLTSGDFSLDTSHANNWSAAQSFNGGFNVGGSTYTNLAGSGLSITGGTLSSTLGTSIDTGEITDLAVTVAKLADNSITSAKIADGTIATADLADGSVQASKLADSSVTGTKIANSSITFDKIGQGGCTNGQVIKWSGTAWACANDIDTNTDTDTTYGAGSGLSLTSGDFALDTSHANNWSAVQSFDSGARIGGTTFTSLAGSGLSVTGGTLSASLGTSIENSEITDLAVSTSKLADGSVSSAKLSDGSVQTSKLADGSVTAGKLANGAVSLDKLGQNGCTNGQIIKWSGTAWACAADNNTDTDTTYSAGNGLTLSGTTLSLDTARANTWTAAQTFSNGIAVGGNTYTSLAGYRLEL